MKKNNARYDIFISYRRSDGFATARLIYDRLEKAGYRVSFDMETLRSGNFNTQLYERIENCRDVIVIVSKEALQFREKTEHDWLRMEVAHALKHNKNIIPVFLREVNIPSKDDMPEDIADLVMKNGVTASEEHFDSTVDKLCRMLLSRRKINLLKIVWVLGILLLLSVGFGYSWHLHQEQRVYNQFIFQISLFNQTSRDYGQLLDAAVKALTTGKTDDFKKAKRNLEKSIDKLKRSKITSSIIGKGQGSNAPQNVDRKNFQLTHQKYLEDITRFSNELENLVEQGKAVGIERLKKLVIIRFKKKQGKLLSEKVSLNCIALLHKAPKAVLDKFKKIQAPQLKYLPLLSSQWPEYENVAAQIKQVNDKIKNLSPSKGKISEMSQKLMTLLVKQAQKGNAEAQYRLGNYYRDGVIIDPDLVKAIEWYKKASDQGHKKAQEALKELQKNIER